MGKVTDLNATKRSDIMTASITDGRDNLYIVGNTYNSKLGLRNGVIRRWSILGEAIWDYTLEMHEFTNFIDIAYANDKQIYALGTTTSEQFISVFDDTGKINTCVKFNRGHMTVFEAMTCDSVNKIYTVGKRFTADTKVIPMLCITCLNETISQYWVEIEDSRIETFLDLSYGKDNTFHALGFSGAEGTPATMWLSNFSMDGHLIWEREIDPIVNYIHSIICDADGKVYIVGHNGNEDNTINILDVDGVKIADMDIPSDVLNYKHTLAYNPRGMDNQLLLVGSKHKDIVLLNVSELLETSATYTV